MSATGRVLVVTGGAIFIASLAGLHYVVEQSFWQVAKVNAGHFTSREPIILTAVAALAIVAALVSALDRSVAAPALAAVFSALLLGQWFWAGEITYSGYGPALWVCTGAALLMTIGGVMSLAGFTRGVGVGASSPGLGGHAPAAGWYADPADPARQRYWSGVAWTEHTQ